MPTKWLQERSNGSNNEPGMPPRRASRGNRDPCDVAPPGIRPRRCLPHGGLRPFHQKSTCPSKLTLQPCVAQIWSRNTRDFEPLRPSEASGSPLATASERRGNTSNGFYRLSPECQGQNLALTELCVPNWPDRGRQILPTRS